MCDCCGKLFLTVVTLCSIGVTTAAVLALFSIFQVQQLNLISEKFNIGLIVLVCVTFIVFCFAIYASCCGEACARIILGVIYLAYGVALVALASLLFLNKDKVLDETSKLWKGSAEQQAIAGKIEEAFGCHCWDENSCLNGTNVTDTTCQTVLTDALNKYWKPIAISLVIFGLLMLVGMVVAFVFGSKSDSSRDDGFQKGITYEGAR
jgi:hypothetical protein